jgi:hypothetical protein
MHMPIGSETRSHSCNVRGTKRSRRNRTNTAKLLSFYVRPKNTSPRAEVATVVPTNTVYIPREAGPRCAAADSVRGSAVCPRWPLHRRIAAVCGPLPRCGWRRTPALYHTARTHQRHRSYEIVIVLPERGRRSTALGGPKFTVKSEALSHEARRCHTPHVMTQVTETVAQHRQKTGSPPSPLQIVRCKDRNRNTSAVPVVGGP